MDPIRTAVKFALTPLRVVVQLGDLYVSQGEPPEVPTPAAAEETRKATGSQPRARRTAKPSQQASGKPKDLDDVALARKVETIIFRDDSVPKGHIDVNAADGVVWLRGEAKTPDMIKALERQAAAIPEVQKVENLLHLPKTPAPTRSDTPPSQRRTRSSTKRPAARKVSTGITNERRSIQGEPLPEELARQGEGRRPAPLGSHDSGNGSGGDGSGS
jgi:hypothetical protein